MVLRLLEKLFGCQHPRTTFPITTKKKRTYISCLDCGKEFEYDWNEMKIVEEKGSKLDEASTYSF